MSSGLMMVACHFHLSMEYRTNSTHRIANSRESDSGFPLISPLSTVRR